MGALANAAILRIDPTFRSWVETATIYVARLVLSDDSGVNTGVAAVDKPIRKQLALDVATAPGFVTDLYVAMIAADPTVVGPPNSWSSTSAPMEAVVIDRVTSMWTAIAKVKYQ